MILQWTEGAPAAGMDEAILLELAREVAIHPWWQARARLTLRLLRDLGVGRRVADVGCGWGVTLEALERAGYVATGLDVTRRALERLDRPGRRLVMLDLARPFDPPERFDAVLALDVVEHLDDDRGAVAALARLAAPGGWVVVSVPALPWLWSDFDRVQGHRRRYRPRDLRVAFAGTGLSLERLLWWGAWMVPLAAGRRGAAGQGVGAYRRYLRMPAPLRPVARALHALEDPLARRGLLPLGTSLIAVARRR